jgi:ketosteroid isomerase-like protein
MLRPGTALLLVAGVLCGMSQSGCMPAPKTETTVPDTRAQDEKAIRDAEAAWMAAFATKQPEKAAAFYADDADSMLPDTPLMAGKAAIIAGMKPELGDPNFSLVFAPSKVEIAKSGDIAYSKAESVWDRSATTSKSIKSKRMEPGKLKKTLRRKRHH